jgi:hypothetical protein
MSEETITKQKTVNQQLTLYLVAIHNYNQNMLKQITLLYVAIV